MKPLLVLGLLLVACSYERTPDGIVFGRKYEPDTGCYYVQVTGIRRPRWQQVTAEEFRVIDVGDSWLAPE
jgi:hypothetical protein